MILRRLMTVAFIAAVIALPGNLPASATDSPADQAPAYSELTVSPKVGQTESASGTFTDPDCVEQLEEKAVDPAYCDTKTTLTASKFMLTEEGREVAGNSKTADGTKVADLPPGTKGVEWVHTIWMDLPGGVKIWEYKAKATYYYNNVYGMVWSTNDYFNTGIVGRHVCGDFTGIGISFDQEYCATERRYLGQCDCGISEYDNFTIESNLPDLPGFTRHVGSHVNEYLNGDITSWVDGERTG